MNWFTRGASALAFALILSACGGGDDGSTDASAEGSTTGSTASEPSATGPDEAEETDSTDLEDDADTDDNGSDDDNDESAGDEEPEDDESEDEAADEAAPSEDDPDGEVDDSPRAGPSQAGALAFVSIDFSTAEIELVNTTDAPIDINGWVFCNFPNYAPISGVDPIGPGETATVTSTVAIPPTDGELGLYLAEDFTDPGSIVAYVEWGSDGHTRASVATEAGIWDGTALSPDGSILTVSD